MAHMLVVPAFELGNPVAFVVLMETGNATAGHVLSPTIMFANIAASMLQYLPTTMLRANIIGVFIIKNIILMRNLP